MKTFTTCSLLLSLFLFFITSTISVAQRNKNPYKIQKERTLIIDESNIYDSKKDTKRRKLSLKDSVLYGDFAEFVSTVQLIKNPSLIDENSDFNLYSRLFMDTYQKHFDITNGIEESIILAPEANNSLYLIGKLDSMPQGITALLFYSFEGTSIQFTKLVTFDETGIPIAAKEVQYYIKGSLDKTTQEGKAICQINLNQTISCINYVEKEQIMAPQSETIYQIQENGMIEELKIINFENYIENQIINDK